MQGLNNFLVAVAVIVGGVLCGYLLRRLRIIDERHGPRIALLVVAVGLPLITCLSVWPITIESRFTLLPVIQTLSFIVVLLISVVLVRLHSLGKQTDRGTFVLACALSNQGYTMGGLVCYLFFGAIGLGLSRIYVAFWPLLLVLVLFPLANSYSGQSAKKSIGTVIFEGIWHVRSLSMVGLGVGIAFSLLKVPYPHWIQTYYLLKILVIVGTFVSFGVIGLSLHLDHIGKYGRLYLSQGFVKFIIAPLVSVVLVVLLGFRAWELPGAVAVIQGFMPTAVNSVLIASLFGLNTRMASALFVVNTAIFLVLILPILALAFVVF